MRPWRLVPGIIVLLAVATGCGSSSSGEGATATPGPTEPQSSGAASLSSPPASQSAGPAFGRGTFADAGSVGASLETATRLADGRVLLAGGQACSGEVACPNSAEARVFEPATGSYATVGPMGSARTELSATLLGDGSVLVAGGSGKPETEVFDPATGKFAPGAAMAVDRYGLTAARLADGRVLIAGGKGERPNSGLASVEVYDPATRQFTTVGSMAEARWGHAATLLTDGRVLIAGGEFGIVGTPVIEVFDPATGAFTTVGRLPGALVGLSATTLADGRVLLAGGRPAATEDEAMDSKTSSAAYLFDPATTTLSPTGSLVAAREGHTATLLVDGRVLLAGGWRDNAQVASAEVYRP